MIELQPEWLWVGSAATIAVAVVSYIVITRRNPDASFEFVQLAGALAGMQIAMALRIQFGMPIWLYFLVVLGAVLAASLLVMAVVDPINRRWPPTLRPSRELAALSSSEGSTDVSLSGEAAVQTRVCRLCGGIGWQPDRFRSSLVAVIGLIFLALGLPLALLGGLVLSAWREPPPLILLWGVLLLCVAVLAFIVAWKSRRRLCSCTSGRRGWLYDEQSPI